MSTAESPRGTTDQPLVRGGGRDLRLDCTQADFRSAAASFHNEFFGEHPDNTLFANLLKCILAKIDDERQTKRGDRYRFQVFSSRGKEETAAEVFSRVNDLYQAAYVRCFDPDAAEPDALDPRELPPERVKAIVKVLQGMSLTRGAARHADVLGAFFEEILRVGFKQDKGMFFTHANLVAFILEAVDLEGLTVQTWKRARRPDDRLPCVIDPACGSGAFLLQARDRITRAVRSRKEQLATDPDSRRFLQDRLSNDSPHAWAEQFLYGMDPKFIMAVTARVNMVLHGGGSGRLFKYDALKPLSAYADERLRPAGDADRTLPRSSYPCDVAESFDLVVSNPPFGVTLSPEAAAARETTFSLKGSTSSECLFLERWFQLLKPGGRLGVVVPESFLNASGATEARLFLYRMFWIRAIVALPRNLFLETPTRTSLLFAQKKTRDAVARWDEAWGAAEAACRDQLQRAAAFLRQCRRNAGVGLADVAWGFLAELRPLVSEESRLARLPAEIATARDACRHYADLMKRAGFQAILRNHLFSEVVKTQDYEYPVYVVEEVGYKLSKRKERIRPNQLCYFRGVHSGKEQPNLHLADEGVELVVDVQNPQRILDYIRRDVTWE
jgi:type I restriction enzyme M protein